jgi:uncharacterized protein (TIGR00255 family)
MTAFARVDGKFDGAELVWELRSVNHRYLEVYLRLPDDLRHIEPLARERISARLNRGKVEGVLRCNWEAQQDGALELDRQRLAAVIEACREVEKRSPDATSPGVVDLLRWPGVAREPEPDAGTAQQGALTLLEQGLEQLVATREREGAHLSTVLTSRMEGVEQQVQKVRARLPEVRSRMRDKLESRLAELNLEVDTTRLEQELVYLTQKMDVDEELDRLQGHVEEARRVIARSEPIGRRLDFLMQEFNREANTLASKSADSETTAAAVELKVLIEQMREQVQNVE